MGQCPKGDKLTAHCGEQQLQLIYSMSIIRRYITPFASIGYGHGLESTREKQTKKEAKKPS